LAAREYDATGRGHFVRLVITPDYDGPWPIPRQIRYEVELHTSEKLDHAYTTIIQNDVSKDDFYFY
jgi:hypothetical protein